MEEVQNSQDEEASDNSNDSNAEDYYRNDYPDEDFYSYHRQLEHDPEFYF